MSLECSAIRWLTIDTNAFPPHVLLVRGTAAIDIVDGVPPEYLAASRKAVGPDQWDTFEAQVRAMYKQMARIKITPLWAKLLEPPTLLQGGSGGAYYRAPAIRA
jgi:hypothetical protein